MGAGERGAGAHGLQAMEGRGMSGSDGGRGCGRPGYAMRSRAKERCVRSSEIDCVILCAVIFVPSLVF
jgi:hypothetical protein